MVNHSITKSLTELLIDCVGLPETFDQSSPCVGVFFFQFEEGAEVPHAERHAHSKLTKLPIEGNEPCGAHPFKIYCCFGKNSVSSIAYLILYAIDLALDLCNDDLEN